MYLCGEMEVTADIHYHGPVVAFDLDDTLFSERQHAVQAYREIADMDGPNQLPQAFNIMREALDEGRNPFNALDDAMYDRSIGSATGVADWLRTYRAFCPSWLPLYPDAEEVLDALQKANVRMALLTDGRSHTQRAKIQALGIESYFHPADILISEETGYDKTSAENFIALVHHYPEASRFIYIGDNPAKDFEMPSQLGWECYCLRAREGNIHPQPATANATRITHLTDILAGLNL